jgi:hypothetical protein
MKGTTVDGCGGRLDAQVDALTRLRPAYNGPMWVSAEGAEQLEQLAERDSWTF